MNRSYRAELLKLRRPATAAAVAVVAALGVLATVLTFALAKSGPPPAGTDNLNLRQSLVVLARPEGLTAGFVGAVAFIGLLALVVFTVNLTNEYGQGTLRTVLVASPRRATWLAGRIAALLTAAVAATAVALVASVATAVVMAQIRGVDTSQWFTLDALGHLGRDSVNALLGVMFFGLAGVVLAILVRSTAIAVALGVAWTFPLEHIVQGAWPAATHVFPGLAFDAVTRGGVPDAAYGTALAVAAGYALAALAIGFASFSRRDVTA
jgi:ABC-type transport system involved in multi-copper enzyme maturation permease subunit